LVGPGRSDGCGWSGDGSASTGDYSAKFRERTILTIAHRVDTVMDSDRFMALNQGRMVEFGTPAALLADQSSIFYSPAKQSENA
ncbi:ATP-binding cassette bilirubin transporter bpt1, partial [Gamsiella multidivaricata]